MAFVVGAAVRGNGAAARRAARAAGRSAQPVVARAGAVRRLSMKVEHEHGDEKVLNMVEIVQALVHANMTTGHMDTQRTYEQIRALLGSEMRRSREYVAGAAALMKDVTLPLATRQAAAALFSAIVVGGALLSGPAQGLAAPAPAAVMSARIADAQTSTPEAPAAPMEAAPRATGVGQVQNWRYSEFIQAVRENKVEKVTFSSDSSRVLAVDTDGARFKLDAVPNDPELLKELTEHKVDVTVLPTQEDGGVAAFLQSLIFPALLFGGLFLLSRGAGGGAGGGMGPMGRGGPMDLAKSGARMQMVPETGVTFNEVAGCDQAKIELAEVVQFLKEAERFTEIGAKIPRGVILEGPPGTGKTLLARAVAGEAGVPFFSIAGSEFVEMFVGVGASRVRDLFSNAKKNAPCIIFIDEIDAVGRQRGAGIAGGNDEREQTLNQMLVEMDGFEANSGIIVIAATNRSDVLDRALLRPGRFDRRIIVDLPDFKGRSEILKVHCRGKPLAPDVDVEGISRRTPGYSGAQLQNLMNEAAIFAARREKKQIGMEEIEAALERVMLGPEKKDSTMTQKRKELVAYHEAGHAIVGAMTAEYDQVAKITIVPRGGAGGLTFFAPSETRVDSGLYSRQFLEAQLAVALGGRLAEELIYGEDELTTGASNDFQQVSRTARMMVTRFGFSEKIGQIALEQDNSSPFMGRQMGGGGGPPTSKLVKDMVEEEVSRLVDGAYKRGKKVLQENMDLLHELAAKLIEQETVSAEEFQRMIAERNVRMVPYAVLN
ncbi:ATP-dependent zinc metalloprotease FTSH, chloroplastic [Porphyridium purpureum]|uniref:ATP-dependent zinc metalloprotease FTSH, chloroplastic n=1 Tax=Porphyridium purpureum TaxID=35688 RepID=A0A5J4YLH6_PORPP|nr:ATP-dependent zinc metalloprotease FTSH, chloroplastic [Porphyridium purpureum]|eukprot:POR7982..scf244_11